MKTRYFYQATLMSLLCSTAFTYNKNFAFAQLTPDDTLGGENSVVTPDGLRDLIEGGAIRDGNLFHSFLEFNVGDLQEVFFANPAGIFNILTRVTGNNVSNIFGTLGVDGAANLILINPNGINFGPNASLNVAGSFLATTADSILFDNGFEFSATNPQAPPLITINIPVGLQYGGNPGDINVNQSVLEVEKGQSLAFLGGNLTLDNAQLIAPGGRIELGGLSAAGIVGLNEDFSTNFPEGVARGDVSLTGRAKAIVASDGGGDIGVNAQNLTITGESTLRAGIAEDSTAEDPQAGNIVIDVIDAISLNGNPEKQFHSNGIENNLLSNGQGGDVNVTTGTLSLTRGSFIQTSLFRDGQGDAGDVTINATGSVEILGSSIQSWLERGTQGNAGDVNINADSVDVIGLNIDGFDRNASIRSRLNSGRRSEREKAPKGNGGTVTITTNDLLVQDAQIDVQLGQFAQGNAGNIIIDTGETGSVTLQATDALRVRGSNRTRINIQADNDSRGNGGSLNIITGSLSLRGAGQNRGTQAVSIQGQLGRRTIAPDGAGDITIQANSIEITNNARIESSLSEDSQGSAGNINITTETLALDTPNARIKLGIDSSQQSTTIGESGTLLINADAIRLSNGANFQLSLDRNAVGQGGNAIINTNSLELIDGGYISSSTNGNGDGGTIEINATDYVLLSGKLSPELFFTANGESTSFTPNINTRIESSASDIAIGRGGQIVIKTPNLQVLDGGVISTATAGDSSGGNITVDAQTLEVRGGGQIISTTAGQGNAGNINLDITDTVTIEGSDPNWSVFRQEILAGLEQRVEGVEPDIEPWEIFTFGGNTPESVTDDVIKTNSPESGVFANATQDGNAGTIAIDTSQFTLASDAQVSVSSNSGQAGNLIVIADNLTLDRGNLTAETGGGGANIDLQVTDLLLLGNESIISANASGAAKGGNIDIDAGFIVALPPEGDMGSDIAANADAGDGGRIAINARDGLIGIEFQPLNTPFNDITANSRLGNPGEVLINEIEINPEQGLTNLPTDLIDAPNLIASTCPRNREEAIAAQQDEFIVTGRGGLPPNPEEPLRRSGVLVDLVTLSGDGEQPTPNPSQEGKEQMTNNEEQITNNNQPIKEAQGWVRDADGKLILTAAPRLNSSEVPWLAAHNCNQ